MFNDILTGKASLEPKPVVADPYRTESIPQITLTCSDCGASYKANAGTPPGRCGVCNVKAAQLEAAMSARAFAEMQEGIERRQRSHWWQRKVLWGATVVVVGLCKLAMREQFNDDMRQASGYRDDEPALVSDPYVDQADSFASQMCACRDAACAQDTMVAFARWERATPSPTDSDVADAASAQMARLGDCYGKLRP